MKCPQCGFVASDSKDACPKCRLDLIPHKLRLGIITAAPAKAKEASPQAAEAGTPSTANQVPGLVQPPAATRESTSGAATADEIARKGSWLLRVFSKPPKVELEAPAFDLHLAAAENTPAPSVEKALQGAAPAPETAQSKPAASAAAPDAGQSKPKPDTVPAPEEDFSDLILAL
ncbi:MAG TPA: hypothetical protein PLP17_15000, partial [Oligoflexia bacterium]|nr:hypothetical protein [Oligoflexia bacterium]